MKIREFQQRMAEALNGLEDLVKGGCKAIAEDTLDVVTAVETQLAQTGGVAVVVTTPSVRRDAGGEGGGMAVCMTVKVSCVEVVATNRDRPGHMTALDAAEAVAHALDGETFGFTGIEQYGDEQRGTVTATATFDASVLLD